MCDYVCPYADKCILLKRLPKDMCQIKQQNQNSYGACLFKTTDLIKAADSSSNKKTAKQDQQSQKRHQKSKNCNHMSIIIIAIKTL